MTRLIPFLIAVTDKSNIAIQTRALVIAVKGSIFKSSPLELTMIKVFWSVRIDTRALINPI
ncbi:MAG: hypothetical protein IKR65_04725 [Selenomonadaceae bacterium]|nr:hypothetical protein [Selenomonadaceae bacterium]